MNSNNITAINILVNILKTVQLSIMTEKVLMNLKNYLFFCLKKFD